MGSELNDADVSDVWAVMGSELNDADVSDVVMGSELNDADASDVVMGSELNDFMENEKKANIEKCYKQETFVTLQANLMLETYSEI